MHAQHQGVFQGLYFGFQEIRNVLDTAFNLQGAPPHELMSP
jgi:hypothetical protein